MSRDLFLACRKGDFDRVKYLVLEREAEVNSRDEWDCTPLYLACLCGHINIVRFLLENGAKCEATTFDGERCIYGALYPDIRKLLVNFKVLPSMVIRREYYFEFLRKLLESGEHSDIVFCVHGFRFFAHRAILSARSAYFAEALDGKWAGRQVVTITNPKVTPEAFRALLWWVYTEQTEVEREGVEDVIALARQARLPKLYELLHIKRKAANFFQKTKPGTRVRKMLVEPTAGARSLSGDLKTLAEEAVPSPLRSWPPALELPLLAEPEPGPAPAFPDIIFRVAGLDFHCHQAFFCSRSEYFRTMVADPLGEQSSRKKEETGGQGQNGSLPVYHLRHFTAPVFLQILNYLYTDSIEVDWETVGEVLVAGDMCLLPGLTRACGAWLGSRLSGESVLACLNLARTFALPRLEDQAYAWIAANLEEMVEDEEFQEMILQDAAEISNREAVDSIDLIDNVRYHITATSIHGFETSNIPFL